MSEPDPTPIRSTRDADEAGPWTLSRAVRLYMVDVTGRTSSRHYKGERSRLEGILGRLGDRPISEIKKPLVLEYRHQRLTRDGVAKTTVNHEVDALRRCLDYAVENDALEYNVIRDVKKLAVRPKDRRKVRRSMTDDEYDRFVPAAWEYDQLRRARGGGSIPQTPLYLTLLNTGGRKTATLNLRWRHWEFDVDLAGDGSILGALVTFPASLTKTGKGRVIPAPPECSDAVQSLIAAQERVLGKTPRPGDRVFLTPRGEPWTERNSNNALRTFYRLLQLAHIERSIDGRDLDLHSCRKTYSTRLHRAGVELGDRQDLLGHADSQLTEVAYTDRDVAGRMRAVHELIRYEAKRRGISEAEAEQLLLAALVGDRSNPGADHHSNADAAFLGNAVHESHLRAEDDSGNTEDAMTSNTSRVTGGWRRHPDSNRGITDLQSVADSSSPQGQPSTGPDAHDSEPVTIECDALQSGHALWIYPEDLPVLAAALAELSRGGVVLLTGRRPGGGK